MRTSMCVMMLGLAALFAVPGQPEAANLDRLREAIEQVVDHASGEIGVAIKHLESGQQLEVNGGRVFPMASTFKIPILVELFNQVDEGSIRLDEMVPLEPDDLHLGSGQLKEFFVPGVSLSIENLALLMMRLSDNSATDLLLERVGVENVRRRLKSLGIQTVSVDRSCQRLILDWLGIAEETTRGMTYGEIEDMLNAYKPAPGELEEAAARFEADPRDSATPLGMNRLLESIVRGEAARPESCRKMLDIMRRCDTGRNRIRGLLPASVEVAHKTGSIGGVVNNVGVIFLPENRGHVLVSVLSRGTEDLERTERVIADIARYAYDYFLFMGQP